MYYCQVANYPTTKTMTTRNDARNLIAPFKSVVPQIWVKRGTVLFRGVDVTANAKEYLLRRQDSDTDKTGIYFGNGPLIPLGMAYEYGKPLKMLHFITTQDILCYVGKYSSNFIDDKNGNHFDVEVRPILNRKKYEELNYDRDEGEVFIANETDLKKLHFLGEYIFDPKTLHLTSIVKEEEE